MVGQNLLHSSFPSSYSILAPSKDELNLLHFDSVIQWFRKNKPDGVIHAAGIVGGIQANIKSPIKFFSENMRIGINILEASRLAEVQHFINLASSCMYPKNASNPLNEDQILSGRLEPTNEGYALAKIATERLCKYFSDEGTNGIYRTLVPCNIYGIYDSFDPLKSHMIPAVIRKLHEACEYNSKTVTIWGDGSARREFMFSKDLANAIWFCFQNISHLPQTINVGQGVDYSILEYYDSISKVVGYKGDYDFDLNKPSGMKQKLIDSSKLHRLGWAPKFSLMKVCSRPMIITAPIMLEPVDMPMLPLASASWDESEINAMHRVIASGNFSMGREVSTFEQQFSQYIGSKYSVMVNSGSSANLLMVAALFLSRIVRLNQVTRLLFQLSLGVLLITRFISII